jgi:hypothetical protein
LTIFGQTSTAILTNDNFSRQYDQQRRFVADCSKNVRILCSDPLQGLWEITQDRTIYHTILGLGYLGKVDGIALGDDRAWLALYCDSES